MPPTSAEEAPPPRRRSLRGVVLVAAGLLVVVATFAFLLPQIADYGDVWSVVRALSWPWVGALLAVAALNIITFAPPWQVVLPGLGFVPALAMTQASAALALVLPGGGAAGVAGAYGVLRSWRFGRRDVARAVTLTSLWNQLANLAYPIVALFMLTVTGGDSALLATAAFVGAAVFGVAVAGLALVLVSNRMARDIGDVTARLVSWARRRLRRGPVSWGGGSFERFRRDGVDLLRRRWHLLTLATLVGSLSVFAVLVVSLRAVGASGSEVSLAEAFAAWALVRLIASVPITPGGIGVVELGLTGALVAFGGGSAEVVAAVLVFRCLTVVPTLLLGLLASLTFRRHRLPPPGEKAPAAPVL